MISITLDTTVYGVVHANAIHIGGITDGNTPIAEIPGESGGHEYAIFTGEIFPAFSEALKAHYEAFGLFPRPNEVEFITDAAPAGFMASAIKSNNADYPACQDWHCLPATHDYK